MSKTIEQSFEDLENIIANLESKDVTLEDSFKLYEQGMKELANCNDQITSVEKKVMELRADGSLGEFKELD